MHGAGTGIAVLKYENFTHCFPHSRNPIRLFKIRSAKADERN